ncbi:Molybdopterin molybdenumtransferase 1 [Frankliniella fusca]|uniref:Molybdopterin molybdenumtransferase 1 n=1 Tax=Frankliniella fusca TaxID=407009 RepID=A0AAE1GYI1_9NEOP|nr:Molybdopterin molybdenumtransferase 1 [Frankliniella fusca]
MYRWRACARAQSGWTENVLEASAPPQWFWFRSGTVSGSAQVGALAPIKRVATPRPGAQ